MQAIKKLRDKKIFNDQSIVESMIQKNWMGSPVIKRGLLRVKKVGEDDCVCEELGSADGKAYKIKYINIHYDSSFMGWFSCFIYVVPPDLTISFEPSDFIDSLVSTN